MDILRILLIVIVSSSLILILKNLGSNISFYLTLIVVIFLMFIVISKTSSMIDMLLKYSKYLNNCNNYILTLLKIIGITYISNLMSDICKENGLNTFANQIDIIAKITIALMIIPVVLELIEMTVVQVNASELIDSYDFNYIDNSLQKNNINISFKDIIKSLLSNNFDFFSFFKNIIVNDFFKLNYYEFIIGNILLLAFFSGIFRVVIPIFDNGKYSLIANYILIIDLIILLSKIFFESYKVAQNTLDNLLAFYKSLLPVFMACVAAVTGNVTYAVFYQIILSSIIIVNGFVKTFILKILYVNYYITLSDNITNTKRFDKLSNLIEIVIKIICKGIIYFFCGISCIKGLMIPMSDSFKNRMLLRTAKAVPGLGDSLDSISQVFYGSALIIKNSIGMGGALVIVMICVHPLVYLTITYLLLKILSAFIQPIAFNNYVDLIDGIGNIIGLLIYVLCISSLLFIVLNALICNFTNI